MLCRALAVAGARCLWRVRVEGEAELERKVRREFSARVSDVCTRQLASVCYGFSVRHTPKRRARDTCPAVQLGALLARPLG